MSISVVTGLCVGSKAKACVPVCPCDCFYEGEKQLYIHPDQCILCGACNAVCPAKAIFDKDEVPAAWRHSIREAEDFFKNGLPGSQTPVQP